MEFGWDGEDYGEFNGVGFVGMSKIFFQEQNHYTKYEYGLVSLTELYIAAVIWQSVTTAWGWELNWGTV